MRPLLGAALAVALLLGCGGGVPPAPNYICDDSAEMTKYLTECYATGDGSAPYHSYCNCNWEYFATRYTCDANPPASEAVTACRECAKKAGLTCPH